MIPVLQTIQGWPNGNCFQACVASVLELSLNDVPNFFVGAGQQASWTDDQWHEVCRLAYKNNCSVHWLDPDDDNDKPYIEFLESSSHRLHYIAFVKSKNGPFGHAVVMRKGKIVHDPSGKDSAASDPYLYIVFVPRDSGYSPVTSVAS